MDSADGVEHHDRHRECGEGRDEAECEEQASAKFAHAGDDGHRERGPETECREELSGPGGSTAAKSTKQLLRPVRRQRQASDRAQDEDSVLHLASSLASICCGAADDHDRAKSVLRTLLANRAKQ